MQDNNKSSWCSECLTLAVVIGLMVFGTILLFTAKDIKEVFFPSEKVYLLGEKEDCKKAGGDFSYSTGLWLINRITCTKTTYDGNKTITEQIFNYTLNNE